MESGDQEERPQPAHALESQGKPDKFVPHPLRPVTLLILLPAAAGTRIVPPGLLPPHNRRTTSRIVAAHELQRLHLALLLALDVAREVLHRGFRRLPLCLVGVGPRSF